MPRIYRLLNDLAKEGPALTIRVEPVLAVQELILAEGRPVPSVFLQGIIDTGASDT